MGRRKSPASYLITSPELINIGSAEATNQTDGFPHAFMLAFDDPAAADAAYRQFQEGGVIPAHGRGPWVVFMGHRPAIYPTAAPQTTPGPAHVERHADPVTPTDNSWWCCFAGAEPGVYQGL